MTRTRQLVLAVGTAALLAAGSMASAAEIEGKVKSVDVTGRMVTLEDGTMLTLSPGAKVDQRALQSGTEVKASYEEKNGKKMATSIEVRPAAQPQAAPPLQREPRIKQ
jgi:hypothetical protein